MRTPDLDYHFTPILGLFPIFEPHYRNFQKHVTRQLNEKSRTFKYLKFFKIFTKVIFAHASFPKALPSGTRIGHCSKIKA